MEKTNKLPLKEYKVKIKDRQQNCTQTLTYLAESKNQANNYALNYLRKAFGHNDFEIR